MKALELMQLPFNNSLAKAARRATTRRMSSVSDASQAIGDAIAELNDRTVTEGDERFSGLLDQLDVAESAKKSDLE